MEILIARQGDIGIIKVDELPKDAILRKNNMIIAHSDLTGHSQRIQESKLYDFNGKIFTKVLSSAVLIHDEHEQIKLKKGIYELRPQREQTLLDEVRQVSD
mgnify:CR=1 FL=1